MARIDDEIKTKFGSSRQRVMVNMIYTTQWFMNLFSQFLRPYGISIQQHNILRILRGAGDWKTMNEIKELMVDKTPNATRLSDKLLAKELIERKRGEEDRRVVFLRVTKKGLDLLARIDRENTINVDELLAHVSEDEAERMSMAIDKIRD